MSSSQEMKSKLFPLPLGPPSTACAGPVQWMGPASVACISAADASSPPASHAPTIVRTVCSCAATVLGSMLMPERRPFSQPQGLVINCCRS